MASPKFIHRARVLYITVISLTLLFGLFPALLNFFVDPFEMFASDALNKPERKYIEKIHYPLWKFSHYDGKARTVILGDSRARALRNKYWKEFGEKRPYNFAYGGGTIPEIFDTFKAIKSDPNLKTIVIGVQLRSFDESFKNGLNRVPEAIKATSSPIAYLKNWFVTKTAWKLAKLRYKSSIAQLTNALPSFVSVADAADLGPPGTTDVETLLRPEVCFSCDLPQGGSTYFPVITKGPNLGLGRGHGHWFQFGYHVNPDRILPKKFKRQVERNARSDWKGFRFSLRYLNMMKDISVWANAQEDRQLIFFIPPTITEMHNTISRFGLQHLDLDLRHRLARLATVIDFDFPSELTHDIANFSDAYHFNSTVARQMVGEILLVAGTNGKFRKRILKRRSILRCPKMQAARSSTQIVKLDGMSCRIWKEQSHG